MKKTSLLLFAGTLVILGGIGFHQWRTLAHESEALAREQKRTETLRHQLALASRTTTATPAVASSAAAAPAADAATPADAAIRAHIDPWLARVRRLRQAFERNSDQRIPELALLSDEDWLIVARRLDDPDSETDLRRAQAAVRALAVSRFINDHLRPALREFLKISNDQLPADISQLAAYLKPPAEAAMLWRYEMRSTGAAERRGGGEAIAERAPVDLDYDTRHSMTANGGGSSPWVSMFMRTAIEDAQRAFTAANPGKRPTGEVDMLPYIRDPIAITIFEAMSSYRTDHHGASSSNLAELRRYVTEPAARTRLEQMIRAETGRGR